MIGSPCQPVFQLEASLWNHDARFRDIGPIGNNLRVSRDRRRLSTGYRAECGEQQGGARNRRNGSSRIGEILAC